MIAAALALASATPAQSKYMSVDEVKPGMKGYGLTVLKGTKPERFDVEVISTLHNFRPGQHLFLVKTLHPRLEIARTVAGMSGSPIFIDGKMIGAYAYGWFFNVEPIAGVTPIENMLDDLKRPVPAALAPPEGGSPLPSSLVPSGTGKGRETRALGLHRFGGDALGYDLRAHAEQVAEHVAPKLAAPGPSQIGRDVSGSALSPASTSVMAGGLSPRALALATELLEPAGLDVLQTGGGGGSQKRLAEGALDKYVDGGVINVELVRGDISLAGLGTVTHVVGDKLVAFGHPMIGGGIEALPTALGYVHWILSTQNRSFKIGEPYKPLGTLVNDRQASIVVDTARNAPMFPMALNIEGALVSPDTKTKWNMEVSTDPFFAPSFVAIGFGSALESVTGERNDMTWRAVSKVAVKGHGVLELEDFGAGDRVPIGPSDIARSRLVRAVGAVMNNPWEAGQIERIDMSVKVVHKREVLYLRGAQVLESEIDAGQPARVKLNLQQHLGDMTTRTIEIPIDPSLAGEEVRIRLQPGYQAARIVAAPENYAELVRILPTLNFPGETIVASYSLPNQAAAAFEGKVAENLPPGALDILQSTTTSVAPEFFSATKQHVIETSGYIIGQDTVRVKVREVLR